MSEFVGESECTLCTFAIGNNNLIHQAIYACQTCSGESNVCCCAGCAEFCHKDHDVNFVAFGEAYCDCGAAGCGLMSSSVATASKILPNNQHISFDKDGRIGGTELNKSLKISPFACNTFNGLDNNVTHVLKSQCSELVTKSKETFWLGMNDTPRCQLEQLAKIVFNQHISQYCGLATIDSNNSGAEWWVQVKPSNDLSNNSEDTPTGGIDLHYDKDEEIASSFNVGIFPHISTVTYLTEHASDAATIVFEAKANDTVGDSIQKCYISIPEVGKHVSFDGRFLHGAPAQLREFSQKNRNNQLISGNTEDSVRITFLVNVWLNHHPAAIFPLPVDIVNHLNATNTLNTSLSSTVTFNTINNSSDEVRFPITTVKVTSRLTDDEDCEYGEWESIPFVSDKTEWGKSEDETGLLVMMWKPTDIKGILSLPLETSRKGPSKKKTKITHTSSDSPSIYSSNTFEIIYGDENSVARLQYEEDEDADEELAEEFTSGTKVK